jgi:DNA-binding MarR family transcriptional regulator
MPSIPFGTQLIGQTEKSLNAILDRELAGSGVTEPQWVALVLAVMAGGTTDRAQLVARIAAALKSADDAAEARIAELTDAGLLAASVDDEQANVTEAGQSMHSGIRERVVEITQRLWGDLPAEELETAGRVLNTVLERANAELD